MSVRYRVRHPASVFFLIFEKEKRLLLHLHDKYQYEKIHRDWQCDTIVYWIGNCLVTGRYRVRHTASAFKKTIFIIEKLMLNPFLSHSKSIFIAIFLIE